jgi:hypothetical protein
MFVQQKYDELGGTINLMAFPSAASDNSLGCRSYRLYLPKAYDVQ